MEYRQRRLKQGRDRVDEMYKDTHWIDELVYLNRHLIQGLPPFSEEKLLKELAETLGRTHADLLEHVSVQYLPLPIHLTKIVEAALISNHHNKHGCLPLLNSSF